METTRKNLIKDEASYSFTQQDEMFQTICDLELGCIGMRPEWTISPINSLSFASIADDTEAVNKAVYDDAYADTITHSGIICELNGEKIPVGSSAILSIEKRVQIAGQALARLPKDQFVRILNECAVTCKGETIARVFEGKVRAMLSDDYVPLSQKDLFEIMANKMHDLHGTFDSGWIDHNVTLARWTVDSNRVLKAYEQLLNDTGVEFDEISCSVYFTTSDIGVSGANIAPSIVYYKNGWKSTIPLIHKLSLEHKSGATIEKFRDNTDMILSTFEESVRDLMRLSKIVIKHPETAYFSVAKAVGVPKKYAERAWNEYTGIRIPGEKETAHDLYLAMCEILFFMEWEDHEPAPKIAGMSETISRASREELWTENDTGYVK